jgi:hypothetical protein
LSVKVVLSAALLVQVWVRIKLCVQHRRDQSMSEYRDIVGLGSVDRPSNYTLHGTKMMSLGRSLLDIISHVVVAPCS